MKQIYLASFLLCMFQAVLAQPDLNQWTWMKGDNSIPQQPIYGTRGVAAASNKPGGRLSAVTWTDASGNLWMFGGTTTAGNYAMNDLWEYEPSTSSWTWVAGDSINGQASVYGSRGVAAASNKPSARYGSLGWADKAGNLWMFGGYSILTGGAAVESDLWKYTIATNLWTWVGGDNTGDQAGVYGVKGVAAPSNKPGSRFGATGHVDPSGNFWLFGGYGTTDSDIGYLNDLWKYDPATGLWTWTSGDKLIDQAAVYGTRGQPAAGNKPNGCTASVSWIDSSGNFWLFGGYKYITSFFIQNDLWKYAPASGQWTWMGGDNVYNQTGIYGSQGLGASSNKPGARYRAASWTDSSGTLWLFGGSGYSASASGDLNDLWKWVPAQGTWTWTGGDSSINREGVYGTRGNAALVNKPGAKSGALYWTDTAGRFWLFGGLTTAPGYSRAYNDLWNYSTSSAQWTWTSGDNTIFLYGAYGTKGTAAPENKPGARSFAASWPDAAGNLWLFSGQGYALQGSSGYLTDLWKYSIQSGQWNWVNGDSATGQPGVYGTKGTPAATNKPVGRILATTWTDTQGNFWLFGGGTGPGNGSLLNDLWKYTPANGQWTWISGDNTENQNSVYGAKGVAVAGNKPGSRTSATSWADASGNLWLFGGQGYATSFGSLNDLWRYNIASGLWTWMGGDNTVNQSGVYGPFGLSSPAYKPGSRINASGWADALGNLWLFGGMGYAASYGSLNDLWKYNIATGLWSLIAGTTSTNSAGVYGTKGVFGFNNLPGGRQYAASWYEPSTGYLWLFGGENYPVIPSTPILNDLWRYNPATNRWAWMSGDNTTNQPGVYGTQRVANPANKPGARYTAANWLDAAGNLWLFGGTGYSSNGIGTMNDLWKYTLSGAALPLQFLSFTARRQQDEVRLTWTTSREQNSRSFTVERAAAGTAFDSIGHIAASRTALAAYTFTDRQPLTGASFYRLKQLDQDGSFTYSTVSRIEIQDVARLALGANPVKNTLRLLVQLPVAATINFQITDLGGHLLWSNKQPGSKGNVIHEIPVYQLANGVYQIRMQTGQQSLAKSFIKQ